MPLLLHAAAGIGIGAVIDATAPARARGEYGQGPPAFRTAALVFLSYAPDVAAHSLKIAGAGWGGVASHSLPLAAAASLPLGMALAGRPLGLCRGAAVAVTAAAILLHVLADLPFSPDRQPLWPLAGIVFHGTVPTWATTRWDLALSAIVLAAARLAGWLGRFHRPRLVPAGRGSLAGKGVVLLLLAFALATAGLREMRERKLEEGRSLVEAGDWKRALPLLEAAGGWPWANHPGRAEELQGEAWLGLGRRDLAERHYLRSLEEDPLYFWSVADMALLEAGAPVADELRAERVRPWVERLERDFGDHPALPGLLRRLRKTSPVTDPPHQPPPPLRRSTSR